MINEKEHTERLRRIAEEETKELSQNHEVIGVAVKGSLASKTVWGSSDLDLLVILDTDSLLHYSRYDKVREGIKIDRHHLSKGWIDDFIKNYPESFIQCWLLLLDALFIMEPFYDTTGYIRQAKEFISKNRFSSVVISGRLEMGVKIIKEGLEKGKHSFMQKDYQEAWRGAREATYAIANLWLEYDKQLLGDKTQDLRFKELSNKLSKPYIYSMYRHILGIDKLNQQELKHLSEDIIRNWKLNYLFFEELLKFVNKSGIKYEGDERPVLILQGDRVEIIKQIPTYLPTWITFWMAEADGYAKQSEIAYAKGYYGFLFFTWITMTDKQVQPCNIIKWLDGIGLKGLDKLRELSNEIDSLVPHINDHRGFSNPAKEQVEEILEVTSELLKDLA